jgi:CrcB protein
MKPFLIVALGGAVGSVARYAATEWARAALGAGFPYGTVAVNVIGSFAMGVLAHLARTTGLLSPSLALGLTTGLLGGFTTYSTFNDDTVRLLTGGAFGRAVLNVGVTLFAGLAAGLAGLFLARYIAPH